MSVPNLIWREPSRAQVRPGYGIARPVLAISAAFVIGGITLLWAMGPESAPPPPFATPDGPTAKARQWQDIPPTETASILPAALSTSGMAQPWSPPLPPRRPPIADLGHLTPDTANVPDAVDAQTDPQPVANDRAPDAALPPAAEPAAAAVAPAAAPAQSAPLAAAETSAPAALTPAASTLVGRSDTASDGQASPLIDQEQHLATGEPTPPSEDLEAPADDAPLPATPAAAAAPEPAKAPSVDVASPAAGSGPTEPAGATIPAPAPTDADQTKAAESPAPSSIKPADADQTKAAESPAPSPTKPADAASVKPRLTAADRPRQPRSVVRRERRSFVTARRRERDPSFAALPRVARPSVIYRAYPDGNAVYEQQPEEETTYVVRRRAPSLFWDSFL